MNFKETLYKFENFAAPRLSPQEKIFAHLFSKLFVFTILFEDTEVDEKIFNVTEDSKVFTISGAGCGVAGHLSKHPRQIDAVDINFHHLALTAAKCQAAKHISSYEEFYQYFSHGIIKDSDRVLRRLVESQPAWIQKYWKRNHHYFKTGIYTKGLLSKYSRLVTRFSPINEDWLRRSCRLSEEQRVLLAQETFRPIMKNPIVSTVLESPLLLFAQGINFTQKERNLKAWGTSQMAEIFLQVLLNVARTDCEVNWILWHTLIGKFNHNHSNGVPPYLREDRFDRSNRAKTRLNFHHASIQKVLANAENETWTHFNLSDALDWMPRKLQRDTLLEVARTAKDGAYLLYRTVEKGDLIFDLGLQKNFQLSESESAWGSQLERTKLYRKLNLYRIFQ